MLQHPQCRACEVAAPERWHGGEQATVQPRFMQTPRCCSGRCPACPLLHTLLCCSHTHTHKRSRAPASSAVLARLPKQLGHERH